MECIHKEHERHDCSDIKCVETIGIANTQYSNISPVATQTEGVVLLPCGPAWSVVVTVTLAQTTVL